MKTFLNIGILIVACIVLFLINGQTGGYALLKDGLVKGVKMLIRIAPMIIIFCVLAGQIEAFYTKRPDSVRSFISGNAGIAKAAFAGAIIPGGASAGPVLKTEWANGGNKFAIIVFIISMNLINWNMILFRLPFFGEKITAWIYGAGILIVVFSVTIMTIVHRLKS